MDNHDRLRGTSRPVRALVLSGGGGRGAYEVGIAKACMERNFFFDWIVGTSIGAINATLLAQDDLPVLEDLWRRIRTNDVFTLGNPTQIRRVVFGQQLGFFDNSKLENVLRQCVNLERLKAGESKVAFATTDLCSLQTKLITADDIKSQDDLIDVLMASASVPLLFPPRKLNGEGCWIDGGLVRNTPIQSAIRLGATEIYAVLVEPHIVDTCPTSIVQLVSRILEILLDHSARSGIAHVNHYNRMMEVRTLKLNGSSPGDWCLLDNHLMLAKDETECGTTSLETIAPPERVRLFIVKPQRQISGSLLEIDPLVSTWLMQMGYEDIIRQCIAVS